MPAFIADLCYDASWRYVEFFTANIHNTHTRLAYARAGARLFTWREQRESLQQKHSAPGVKKQLAAVRMLFDWLITGQVLPTNPTAAVRGPKHVVKLGKTWCSRRRMAQAPQLNSGRYVIYRAAR